MRDFKAGRDINVSGNVHITETPRAPKLLAVCTTEELLHEREFRRERLRIEEGRKLKPVGIAFAITVVCAAIVYVWYRFTGKYEMAKLYLASMGVIAPAAFAWMTLTQDTPVVKTHRDALAEIRLRLQERGYDERARI